MIQQVNLYQPMFRATQRTFSAGAIAGALALLAVSLGLLAGYAALRTQRAEATVSSLEGQEQSRLERETRVGAQLGGGVPLSAVEAESARLASEIALREQVLAVLDAGQAPAGTGFAAGLEAFGRRQMDGLWLRRIVMESGGRRLALLGAATSPTRVPAYLAALSKEPALGGALFAGLELRRALPAEAPAETIFTATGPGLQPLVATPAEPREAMPATEGAR